MFNLFNNQSSQQQQQCKPSLKKVFVPVSSKYEKSYKDLWEDKEYLKPVTLLRNNQVLISEQLQVIIQLREVADNAKTPDELQGANKCIKIFKDFLTVPERAAQRIQMIKDTAATQKRVEGNAAR